MKRFIVRGAALTVALTIGACGGSSDSGSSSDTQPAAAGKGPVSVQSVAGVGRVLVDRSGNPIYTSDQEASGQIVCEQGCTSFWKPVSVAGKLSGGGGNDLGVIKRPDGKRQVTAKGRPLYTFTEDSPGKATGDGFSDDFNGRHFTWHVVRSGGTTTGGSSQGGASDASMPAGGGYGY
jgi:predicted lipoprotein with Yx(FWY)xxD motif